MSAEWGDAAATLAMIAGFIENSEVNEQVIDGQTPDGGSIRVTIRHARADGPSADGGYNVRAFIATGHGIYRMTLRMAAY